MPQHDEMLLSCTHDDCIAINQFASYYSGAQAQLFRYVSWALQDPATIFRMVQKCGPQIFACVNNPDCKAALDCLQACDPTDQVPNARRSHDARCCRILTRIASMLLFVPASVLLPVVQVCSYQCIVTYESQLLEDFSLCILEVLNMQTPCTL